MPDPILRMFPPPPKPRPEPVTAEDRISFYDRFGKLIVFNVPTSCALCHHCLGQSNSGACVFNWFGTKAVANYFRATPTPDK